jgi:AhpD family alkylhydroperoxidase
MDEARARAVVRAVFEDPELHEALALLIERRYVEVPFLMRVAQETPERFIPAALRALADGGALDRRTAELIAVGAAAAQMCEHCLRVHIEEALAHGATRDEVLEALLIAGRIAESSTNAVSLRVLRRVTAGRSRPRASAAADGPAPDAAHPARGHTHE